MGRLATARARTFAPARAGAKTANLQRKHSSPGVFPSNQPDLGADSLAEGPAPDIATQMAHAAKYGHSLTKTVNSGTLQRQSQNEDELKTKPETTLQRQTDEEDKDIQARVDPNALQRQADEDDKELQRQPQDEEELKRQPEEDDDLKEKAIQPKLTIGEPGDKYEQEADQMAARVMRMPDPMEKPGSTEAGEQFVQREAENKDDLKQRPLVQREMTAAEEEDETAQAKPLLQRQPMADEEDDKVMRKPLQREAMPKEDEDETLQAKPEIQAKGEAPAVPNNFDNQLAQHKGSGHPLSDETRAFMEPRFGADFSNVRVHETPDLANAIQAQAFTHGQDIYFNSGKYNPGSSGGKELLAHELTHVVQQSNKQVNSKLQLKNRDSTYGSWLGSEGKDFVSLRDELEKNYGYHFYERIAIGQRSNGSHVWGKGEHRNETPSNEVAWSIKKPNGDWTFSTLNQVIDKCIKLQESTSSVKKKSNEPKSPSDGSRLTSPSCAIEHDFSKSEEITVHPTPLTSIKLKLTGKVNCTIGDSICTANKDGITFSSKGKSVTISKDSFQSQVSEAVSTFAGAFQPEDDNGSLALKNKFSGKLGETESSLKIEGAPPLVTAVYKVKHQPSSLKFKVGNINFEGTVGFDLEIRQRYPELTREQIKALSLATLIAALIAIIILYGGVIVAALEVAIAAVVGVLILLGFGAALASS